MAKENKQAILNRQLKDSSSKLIFGDNILCSQFLRHYADMDILRDIKPEDLEDVTARYSHFFTSERESDVVKKVDIGKYLPENKNGNPLELPLYIVSLIEHKTKVEYNVGMQILCKELLNDYLPHFKYQVVRLHDYSNKELLDKGDEISLTMLINKIRCVEDMEAFTLLPKEQVDEILKDTPEYLLGIIEKMMRALFYSMNLEEEKTENAVSKIKKRKMGRLFEGVTFDFQAARKEFEEKTVKAEADAKVRIEVAEAEAKAAEEKMEIAKAEAEAGIEAAKAEAEAGIKAAKAEVEAAKAEADIKINIARHIAKMLMNGQSGDEIKKSLQQKFALSEMQAEEEYRKVIE